MEKQQEILKLEERIEWHLQNMKLSMTGSQTYKLGERLVKEYCADYKKLTGKYYVAKQNDKN